MNLFTMTSFICFCLAGIFQILYGSLASSIIKNYGVELKLKRFSSYSYNRKHLRYLLENSTDHELKKKLSNLLLFEIIAISCFIATFVIFIGGNFIVL
jgi:hypothetical protein